MKIINLFGQPCAGKSTIRAKLFYEMKINGYRVEEATEYAKDIVYDDRTNILGDQLYILAKQNRRLLRLQDKVDYVITDSPLLLNSIYLNENTNDIFYKNSLHHLIIDVFNSYDNINLFLNSNHKYQEFGRTQTEDDSLIIKHKILNCLNENDLRYYEFYSNEITLDKIQHLL